MYAVEIASKAKRQLKKLAKKQRHDYAMIMQAIDSLHNYPEVTSIRTLINHSYMYRLRVGNYRILFDADDVVYIVAVQEVRKRDESTYE